MSAAQLEVESRHHVRIHIDRCRHESPNPTSGAALYILGNVEAGLELYREVCGNREDKPIPNDTKTVHLKEDEHFHSGQPHSGEFTVFVNGQQKLVAAKELSFAQIVALAFNPLPIGPNVLFTVSYEDGPPANPQGSLKEGGTVKVKDGMIFNVTATDKS